MDDHDYTTDTLAAEARSPVVQMLEAVRAGMAGRQDLTLGEMIAPLHEHGVPAILLLLALPMALPVPVPPVVNVAFALPLLVLAGQQALGMREVWLPAKIKARSVRVRMMCVVLDKVIEFLHRVERLARPRLRGMTGPAAQRVIGAIGCVLALAIMVPLPLTNTVPSLGIALMALGVLMRDGVCVVIGGGVGALWVAVLAVTALLFGAAGLEALRGHLKLAVEWVIRHAGDVIGLVV